MKYELIHNVLINDLKYKITEVTINKSVNSFTNTCTIKLPKRLTKDNQDIFSDVESFLIKKGDVVSVRLGYRCELTNYFFKNQFEGFVSNIDMGEHTVDIVCEDYMYFLKKVKLNFSAKSITLKALGAKIASEVNKQIPSNIDKIIVDTSSIDLTLYNQTFENKTGTEILETLQDYTIQSFFIGNKLSIGINYDTIGKRTDANKHTFSMFPRDLIRQYTDEVYLFIINKDGLNYQKIDDIKFKITVKIFKTNNEVVEKVYGDSDGEERTFIMQGNPSEAEIQAFVKNQVNRIKFEGFQRDSTFSTFGLGKGGYPIEPLDIACFDGLGFVRWYDNTGANTTKTNVYKKASYLIESVQTTFGNGGFRQIIGITQKLSIDEGDSLSDKIGKTIDF